MEDKAGEENDEEVVGVPEDLEIAASDDLHGRRDDEDEGQGDDDAREAGDGGEGKVGRNLLRILESSSSYNLVGLLLNTRSHLHIQILHHVFIWPILIISHPSSVLQRPD